MAAPGATPREPVVRVRGLGRRLAGRTALAGLTLDLRPGEAAALIGANGGGKSTALRLLAGLLRPDAGEGEVLGHDLRREGLPRTRLGFQPQHFALPGELTPREILRFRAEVFGLPDARARVERSLAAFGLGPYAEVRAERLSGGWKARLQLAATLLHGPRLVLLDEPTAGLDLVARADAWARILSLREGGAAVVISTHDLEEAQACDQVVLMADGEVLASGPPAVVAPAGTSFEAPAPGPPLAQALRRRLADRSPPQGAAP